MAGRRGLVVVVSVLAVLAVLPSITDAACGDPVEYDGRIYRVIATIMSWTDALSRAEDLPLLDGKAAHLVTITSSAENSVVRNIVQECGRSAYIAAADFSEDSWTWQAGPEQGVRFWQGRSSGSAVDGAYENWNSGEPNDYRGDEDCCEMRTNGVWNDIRCSATSNYYVAEYELAEIQYLGHRYVLEKGTFTFNQALAAASSSTFSGLRGHLVTFNTDDEFRAVAPLFETESAWIGSRHDAATATWSWLELDNEKVPFWFANGTVGSNLTVPQGNWSAGEPSLVGGCLAHSVATGGWVSVNCVTGGASLGGYVVEYEIDPFTFCPSEIILTTTDLNGATFPEEESFLPVVATALSLVESELVSNFNKTNLFPVGVTTVIHSLTVPDIDVPFICSFDIRVFNGITAVSSSVFQASEPNMDFFVEGSGAFGGGAALQPFTSDLEVNDFTFVLSAARLQQLNIDFSGQPANMVAILQWCTFGDMPPDNDPSLIPVALETEVLDSTDETFGFVDHGSVVTNPFRCFRISAATTSLTKPGLLSFTRARFTIKTSEAFLRRRRAVGEATFLPVVPSIVAVNFTAGDNTSTSFVLDAIPPWFLGCPASFDVIAPDKSAFAPGVTWNEPIAQDNNKLESVTLVCTDTDGNEVDDCMGVDPGTDLSVVGAPFHVEYTATDGGGLTATCAFDINVVFVSRPVGVFQEIVPGTFAASVSPAPLGFTGASVVDYILGPEFGAPSQANFSANMSEFTTLTYTITAPFAQSFVLVPSLPEVQIVFDLVWAAATSGLTELGPTRVSAYLGGITRSDSTPHPTGTSLDVDLQLSQSVVTGDFVRMQGTTAALTQLGEFAFEELAISVAFPGGADAAPALNMTADYYSRLGFSYFYPSIVDVDAQRPLSVFIRDVYPPVIENCPNNITINLTSTDATAVANWTVPNATDNLILTNFSAQFVPGDAFGVTVPAVGPEVVSYIAKDSFDNTATCNFTVTVLDYHPPVPVCPGAQTVVANDSLPDVLQCALPGFAVEHNVSGNLSAPVSVFDNSGSAFYTVSLPADSTRPVGTYFLESTVTDLYDNTATCNVTVNVVDLTNPVNTFCPPGTAVSPDRDDGTAAVTWAMPRFVDNDCDVALTSSHTSGGRFPLGDTVVTYTGTDNTGNQGTCSFTVSVQVAAKAADTRTPVLAGSSVAFALIMIGAIVGAVYHRRREYAKRNAPYDFDEICALLADKMSNSEGVKQPREIKRSHVKILDILGSGNFGQVAKALLEESHTPFAAPSALVAAKMLFEDSDEQDRKELLQEAAFMAQLTHRHVVQLIGVVTQGNPAILVMEYCEYGALNHYMTKHPEHIDDDLRYKMCFDVADGLAYLHSRSIVHRDIAARNVLVNSERSCKISDFGLSRDTSELESAYYQAGIKGQLPVRWCAPEALEERKFSSASDVWGYGILVYEIWTDGATPYRGWTNQKVWVEVVHGYRLPCPDKCPETVHAMMLRCWEEERDMRISAHELALHFSEHIPGSEVPWMLQDHGVKTDMDVYQNAPNGSSDLADDLPLYDAGDADFDEPASLEPATGLPARQGKFNVSYREKQPGEHLPFGLSVGVHPARETGYLSSDELAGDSFRRPKVEYSDANQPDNESLTSAEGPYIKSGHLVPVQSTDQAPPAPIGTPVSGNFGFGEMLHTGGLADIHEEDED
eukprot:m.18795 g.18795  ORF g.18795 m.18795 type:complete len:1677 (-) comp5786_c0_seq2:165-5195(-)